MNQERENDRRTFIKGAVAMTALASSELARGESEKGSNFVCFTCGTQYPRSETPPEHCPICDDERQYVGLNGQKWTTRDAMQSKHKNTIKEEEPGLFSINTEPSFGIGQRAFLIRTTKGNVLWDCVAHLDDATIRRIRELGGVAEIAVSHPHYYTTMVDWSRAFGDPPIHIHERDKPWVMRPDPCVSFWSGETKGLLGCADLVCTGGHFAGFQTLHWAGGAGGRGVLMAGDQPQVCMDPRKVSFMWSYPNMIPLNGTAIRHVKASLAPLKYDRLYGAFVARGRGVVLTDAKGVVDRSADRYLKAIEG